MRKTSRWEQRNLLASSNWVHRVNGWNTSLDHFLWIDSLIWIDGLSLTLVDCLTWMSMNFSANTGGPWSIGIPDPLKDLPSISIDIGILRTSPVNSTWVCRLSMPEVPSKIWLAFSYLNHCSFTSNFKHLTFPYRPISQFDIYDFGISSNDILTWETWRCRG